MKLRSIGATIAGVMVLAGATGVAGIALELPQSPLGTDNMHLDSPSATSTDGRVSLVCMGGVERLLTESMNVDDVEENISGATGALLVGAQPTAVLERWLTFTGTSPQQPSDVAAASSDSADEGELAGSVVTTALLGESQATQTNLATPALVGALSLSRAAGEDVFVAGGSAHRAENGDLRGLAYSSCVWPSTSLWLVGSSSTIGSSNRLVVANPSLTSISVDVVAYTSLGEQRLGTSGTLSLPAQTVKTVALDGLIPEDESVALHLTAASGQFTAQLQSSVLSGYTPQGTDIISGGRSGVSVVIPGLYLPAGTVDLGGTTDNQQTTESGLVDPAISSSVRLVNPQKESAQASVALVGTDGTVQQLPGGDAVALVPGGVLDLSLSGVKPGEYAVRVTSDVEIAAGVMVKHDAGATGADVEWLSVQEPVTRAAAYIGIGTARLIITPELTGDKTRTTDVTWTAYKADGSKLAEESVIANGSLGIALPEGSAYVTLESATPVYGGVAGASDLTNGTGVAWAPLSENASSNSTVYLNFVN